jgi:putative peptidoglycan lipid II flippase
VGARSTGTWLTRVPAGDPSVKEYLILALPLMLGQSIAVLDEQFVRWFGQVEEGATAALSFARQLNMVPVGVIAQAAGVAAFPFLARLAAAGDEEGLTGTTVRAARNTVFVAAAATAALVVLARPLVRVLYQYGEFGADDAELVAGLLVLYAFSIPAWGLHQILSRHFYAKRRMWTVVLIGTAGTIVAIPIWLGLYEVMGVEGFALASTLVMTAYAIALLVAWGLDTGWGPIRLLLPSLARGLTAAAAAVLVSYPLVNAMFDDELSVLGGLGAAVLGLMTTIAAFLGVSYLLRAPELAELRRSR